MRDALLRCAAAMLLMTPLLSQTDQPEPFSFKDDRLGMSLEAFKAKHGNAVCKEMFRTATRCEYVTTVVGITPFAEALFVDNRLAAIHLFYGSNPDSASVLLQQALIDKFGRPEILKATGKHNFEWSALRWDNAISVVEFQRYSCGSGEGNLPSKDLTEMLEGRYCESGDDGDGSTGLWYIHRALSSVFLPRQREAKEKAKKKALSDI